MAPTPRREPPRFDTSAPTPIIGPTGSNNVPTLPDPDLMQMLAQSNPDLAAARRIYEGLIIDWERSTPRPFEHYVFTSYVTMSMLRAAVRYAHARLEDHYKLVVELQRILVDRHGCDEIFLLAIRENLEEDVEHAEHRGDEGWIQEAGPGELMHETRLAAEEARTLKHPIEIFQNKIPCFEAYELMKKEGKITLHKAPPLPSESKYPDHSSKKSPPKSSSPTKRRQRGLRGGKGKHRGNGNGQGGDSGSHATGDWDEDGESSISGTWSGTLPVTPPSGFGGTRRSGQRVERAAGWVGGEGRRGSSV